MELKHLTTDHCPECGCRTVILECVETTWDKPAQIREHVHGGRWEVREFLCGYRVGFVPNFNRDEMKRPCANTPQYREKEAERDRIEKQIEALRAKLSDLK